MKIIAIITGSRKARIINMRTANYDKYKIIFIHSCYLTNIHQESLLLHRSIRRFFLDVFISFLERFFEIIEITSTSISIFSLFSRDLVDPLLRNGARRR